MTGRMADVGGRRPGSPTSEAGIISPLFRRSRRCWLLTSVQLANVQAKVGR